MIDNLIHTSALIAQAMLVILHHMLIVQIVGDHQPVCDQNVFSMLRNVFVQIIECICPPHAHCANH